MRIELSEEMDELVVIVAAIGRINSANYMELYEKLLSNLTHGERVRMEQLYQHLEFSPSRIQRIRKDVQSRSR